MWIPDTIMINLLEHTKKQISDGISENFLLIKSRMNLASSHGKQLLKLWTVKPK
jgi:hypothetical protein